MDAGADILAGEAELVRDYLAGSARAAQEIVGLHYRRIYNFIYQMTRQQQDAEDITQQTFVKAFKNLDRFDPRRPLANWLFTIARRTALNHFRGTRTWEEIPEQTASDQPTPAQATEEHDQVDRIWDTARRALPAREFQVLWLRFGENLSIEETARAAGLTQIHVRVMVHRARKRLMEMQGTP